MAYEEIDDPIAVIAFFEAGKLHPLRFKWRDEVYKIKRINNFWCVNQKGARHHHFSAMSNTTDCFEIVFNSTDFNWKLARVYLEG